MQGVARRHRLASTSASTAIPSLPGLERFKGTVFHSARWNHEHDLSGREVAVLGTGASAPDYRLGCKRILGSNTWYPAISADNVEVVSGGVYGVTPSGIVDEHGVEHRVDTIIFGTGFQVTDPPVSHRVTGRTGETLAESWGGSPRAHLGLAVAGFPNFLMLLGPNTGLGHNSVLLMIEAQVRYVIKALCHLRDSGRATIEPTAAAQARFVEEVDDGTRGSVWTPGGCVSWYLDVTGRNSVLWPGSVRAYQRRLASFEPADYRLELPRDVPSPEPLAA
jgi:cation diffusion facilitator CzcD-associated flavoprotein CzcO